MVGQALLLLADVEFLDVVDQFLLQPVLVVVDIGNLFQFLHDGLSDLGHAALLEGLQLVQQTFDVVDFLGEFLFQSGTFLTAEGVELVESVEQGLTGHSPLLVGELLNFGLQGHVGQAQEG